jgi:multisubunit Na+/H+ antiporter MnhF subunit
VSLFIDRKPRSRRFLAWKTRIFAVAAVIALVGMYLNNPYVTGTALVLLLVGVALRFVPERKVSAADSQPGETDLE